MREGGRIYSPGGRLLDAGDRLDQPGLVAALEVVAAEGARTFYEGTLAESLLALMAERDGLVTRGGPRRLPRRVDRACRGRVRGRPRADARRALAARRHARRPPTLKGVSPAGRALVLARLLAAPLYSGQDLRAHDEPLRRRRGGKRLRDHDQPRSRLGRLPPGLRRPPEQHARRVRPPRRPARSREADGQHDVADRRAGRRRARPRGRGGRRDQASPCARAGALRDPRRGPGARRPQSIARGCTRPARSSTSSPASRRAPSRRSRATGTTCASGTSSTTTSAA